MLEFMVLGEIPGTQIQFNFADVLLAAAWILVFIEASILLHRHRHSFKTVGQRNATASKQTSKSATKPSSKSKLAQA